MCSIDEAVETTRNWEMHMRTLVVVLFLYLIGNPANAQGVFAARDPGAVMQNIYKGLFAGIELPKESRDSAIRVIRNENSQQMAVDGRAPGAWDRRIALNRWRDSTLRVLVRSEAERRVFDANSERMRPQGSIPR